MDVDTVAAELYGLLPEEFVANRAVQERDAKAAGDKALAARIHQLRKPNQVGWLANQLVRSAAADIEPLLELGAELRRGNTALSAEQLRAFNRRRNDLLNALVRRSRELAEQAGKQVSEETLTGVRTTLQAAVADDAAADRLREARLTEGLEHVGFGVGPMLDASGGGSVHPAGPMAPSPAATEARGGVERLERAARELEEAKQASDDLLRRRDEAHAELETSESAVSAADAEVTRLRQELDLAMAAHSAAQLDARRARKACEQAAKAAQDAVRRLEDVTRRHRQLVDD